MIKTVKSLQNARSYTHARLNCVMTRIKGKGKVHPRTGHEFPEGEQAFSFTLSLTSALDGGWVVNAMPQPLCSRERPGTYCIRLGGPQSRSGWVWKISPTPGFDPWTVQPIASHCTNWAIPAPMIRNTTIRTSLINIVSTKITPSYYKTLNFFPPRPDTWIVSSGRPLK